VGVAVIMVLVLHVTGAFVDERYDRNHQAEVMESVNDELERMAKRRPPMEDEEEHGAWMQEVQGQVRILAQVGSDIADGPDQRWHVKDIALRAEFDRTMRLFKEMFPEVDWTKMLYEMRMAQMWERSR